MHFYSFRMKEKMRHKEMEEIRAYKFMSFQKHNLHKYSVG